MSHATGLAPISNTPSHAGCPCGPLILLYHRVATLPQDPLQLAVTPEHFRQHLEVIRQHRLPMSLGELVARIAGDDLPSHAIAITFDDGYADNFECAAPLLQAANIPATVFVAGAYVGYAGEFWWDALEHLLLDNADLPDALVAEIAGNPIRYPMRDDRTEDSAITPNRSSWSVLDHDDPSPRHQAYRSLFDHLRPLEHHERLTILAALWQQTGRNPTQRATHRPVSHDVLAASGDDELLEIGAHTMTHPALATLPVADQQQEIEQSKSRLESITGRTVAGFSYPFGTKRDYTPATVEAVRNGGFDYACSNFVQAITSATSAYELPRFLVRDWDGATFEQRLGSVTASA